MLPGHDLSLRQVPAAWRLEDEGQQRGERSRSRRLRAASTPRLTVLVEREAQMGLGRNGCERRTQPSSGGSPRVFADRERAEKPAKRARPDERRRIDDGSSSRGAPARAEPVGESVRRRDVVARPDRDLRVDEVLDEVERRRSGCTACRLEAWRKLNTPKKYCRCLRHRQDICCRFHRLTPCTGRPAASHA